MQRANRCARAFFAVARLAPLVLTGAAACHRGATAEPTPAEPQTAGIMLAVSALPDSAIKLAKFAMGITGGEVQQQQLRNGGVAVSSRQMRDRRGGGTIEIAIVAALSRDVRDTSGHVTMVQLSGWVLERRDTLPLPQRRGRSQTGPARPPLSMVANKPRPISERDKSDWESLELVLGQFMRLGAQRVP